MNKDLNNSYLIDDQSDTYEVYQVNDNTIIRLPWYIYKFTLTTGTVIYFNALHNTLSLLPYNNLSLIKLAENIRCKIINLTKDEFIQQVKIYFDFFWCKALSDYMINYVNDMFRMEEQAFQRNIGKIEINRSFSDPSMIMDEDIDKIMKMFEEEIKQDKIKKQERESKNFHFSKNAVAGFKNVNANKKQNKITFRKLNDLKDQNKDFKSKKPSKMIDNKSKNVSGGIKKKTKKEKKLVQVIQKRSINDSKKTIQDNDDLLSFHLLSHKKNENNDDNDDDLSYHLLPPEKSDDLDVFDPFKKYSKY